MGEAVRRMRKALLFVILVLTGGLVDGAPMSVQVESAQLRNRPSFLGTIIATAAYADRVEVLGESAGWSEVRTSTGVRGWVHSSALSKKRIVLKAGADDVRTSASGEELALAGKGFNADVEADFKAQNQGVDFTWIDRMETYTVSQRAMIDFLKEGGLQ